MQKNLKVLLMLLGAVALSSRSLKSAYAAGSPSQTSSPNTAINSLEASEEESGMDTPDGDDETVGDDPSTDQKHINFSVYPVLYLEGEFQNHLINLTPATKGLNGSAPKVLGVDDYRSGFRAIERRKLDLGIGVGLSIAVETLKISSSGFGIFAGLIPVWGKNLYVNRFFDHKVDNNKLPKVLLPYLAKDLDTYLPGDRVAYTTKGGMLFSGGVSWWGLSAGATYMAQGEWTNYLEKEADQIVYVKHSKNVLNAFEISAGTPVTELNLESFRETDDNFSFRFDLTDPAAARAYELMMKGDLRLAQKLAAVSVPLQNMAQVSYPSSVVLVATGGGVAKGLMGTWWAGVPLLLNKKGAAGNIYSIQHTSYRTDGSKTNTHYGIFVRQSSTQGLVSHHTHNLRNFYGKYRIRTAPNGIATIAYAGRFKWLFDRNHMSSQKFVEALQRLGRLTGLTQEVAVEGLPKGADLGYTKVEFVADLSQETTDHLMGLAADNNSNQATAHVTEALIANYFANGQDPDGLCFMADHTSSVVHDISLKNCIETLTRDTRKALVQMQKALVTMAQASPRDPKGFVQAYADFGEAMMATPFSFQAVLASSTHAPLSMRLKIYGERVSLMNAPVLWLNSLVQN